jgi:hypothetical protein
VSKYWSAAHLLVCNRNEETTENLEAFGSLAARSPDGGKKILPFAGFLAIYLRYPDRRWEPGNETF